MHKLVLAVVAASLAVPAFAASDPAPAQPEQSQPPKKEKKICKRVNSTESRIAINECRTAAEWARNPNVAASRSSISGQADEPSGPN